MKRYFFKVFYLKDVICSFNYEVFAESSYKAIEKLFIDADSLRERIIGFYIDPDCSQSGIFDKD